PAAPAAPSVAKAPPVAKQLEAKPAVADGGCADAVVKPKPLQLVQPTFTQDARDAGITGKVRVEVTISAAGAVTAARVIEGLGHGLDEAALDAARASTFAPATKCGEPVAITITIGMRFQT
ncbi:MAG: energy transducer TonB, partial [Deltaproteobacteria bacterium]|nr:energy transducer TonB [Deltaproteobacteria bacterium]